MRAPVTAAVIVRDDPKVWDAIRSIHPYVSQVVVVVTAETIQYPVELSKTHPEIMDLDLAFCPECNDPTTGEIADFAMARNRSLELATQPWWMYFDSDDVIAGGERLVEEIQALEAIRAVVSMAQPGVEVVGEYHYWYSMDDQGRPTRIVPTRRILSNPKAWHWIDPCHEVLELRNGHWPSVQVRDAIVWKHHREAKPSDRNLRILESHVSKVTNPRSRVLFYLGNEYADAADFWGLTGSDRAARVEQAVATYDRYLKDVHCPQDERYMAALRASKLQLSLGKYDDALHWASMAMCFNETLPAAYLQMGNVFYARANLSNDLRDHERCLYVCDLALRAKGTTYMWTDPGDAFQTQFLRSFALMKLGRMREAIDAGVEAMKLRPEESDPHRSNIAFNTRLAEANVAKEEAAEFVRRFEALKALKHDVIDNVLREVPAWGFLDDPKSQIDGHYKGNLEWLAPKTSLRILFMCGAGSWEKWSPESVKKTGIGGSETAVIEMARRLANRGHTVVVWSEMCDPGTYDGVSYVTGIDRSGRDVIPSLDVVVAWRDAKFFDLRTLAERTRKVLWVHDVWALNESYVQRADTIFALTHWHADFLVGRGYPKDKIVVTTNGIDFGRFSTKDGQFLRNPKQVIYSSSPDRGLKELLLAWPKIREFEPQAELHVFYGFANWDKSEQTNVDRDRIKALIFDLRSQAVMFHGRVDQQTLAMMMMRSGVWAYPTWFSETYAITLDEALAAGLYVMTTPVAALKERGEGLVTFVGSGPYDRDRDEAAFVEAVVRAIREEGQPKTRAELVDHARRRFDWENTVTQWEDLFGVRRGPSYVFKSEPNPPVVQAPVSAETIAASVAPAVAQTWTAMSVGAAGPLAEVEKKYAGMSAKEQWEDYWKNPLGAVTKMMTPPRRIHFVLTKYGCGEPPIDPMNPFATTGGGGSRVGFIGLVRAFAALRKDWNVFAWSNFSVETTVAGVDHRQVDRFPNIVKDGDVVFAFYDTSPLGQVSDQCLRIASHHTYQPPWDNPTGDIHVAPSEDAMKALAARWKENLFWRVLPNGVGDRPVVRKPVKGRIIYHTSADRGLHHLLEAMSEIRKAVPEATLHVVGGVEEWVRWAQGYIQGVFPEARRRADIIKSHWNDPGVTFTGKLSFDALMTEFGEASVFAYPCDPMAPCETFSISTMECLKMGIPVVLHPADALGEIYDGHVWLSKDVTSMFADLVARAISRDMIGPYDLADAKTFAGLFTFEAEAQRLSEIIAEYEQGKTFEIHGPIGPFRIPAYPLSTHAHVEAMTRGVWEGEYDHPGLPNDIRSIVDVGCGWGAFAAWAYKRWPGLQKLSGFDPNIEAIRLAWQNVQAGEFFALAVTTADRAVLSHDDAWGSRKTYQTEGVGTSVDVFHPKDLPACDLLKLDGEGIELEVLEVYPHKPRVVIYEFHHLEHRDRIRRLMFANQYSPLVLHAKESDTYGVDIWVRP